MKNWISKQSFENIVVLTWGWFLLIPNQLKPITVLLLVLLSLIKLFKGNDLVISRYNNWLLVFPFFYLSFIFLGVQEIDNDLAYLKLQTMLPLVIIPLSFLTNPFSQLKKSQIKFAKSFIYSNIIFLTVFSVFSFVYENPRYKSGFFHVDFMRDAINEMPLIGLHPIYASLIIGLCIILLNNLRIGINIYLKMFFNLIFFFFLLLFSSKMVIISLSFLLFLFGVRHIYVGSFFTKKQLIITLTLLGGIVLMVWDNHRVQELFKIETYSKIHPSNSTSIRIGILKCVANSIGESPISGYGFVAAQKALNKCYQDTSPVLMQGKYNSHNQFLGWWLYGGLGLFLLGIISFIVPGFIALKFGNKLLLLLTLYFLMNLITENIIERNVGVTMFSFFIGFWGSKEELGH